MINKQAKYKFPPLETMVAQAVCGDHPEQLTPKLLEEYQLHELKKQITYAKENSKFFAKHLQKIDLDSINCYKDLGKIPLMSAEDIINEGPAMACLPLSKIPRFTTIRSSGTSGPAKQLYFTDQDLDKIVDFFVYGGQHLTTPMQRVMIYLPGDAVGSIAELLTRSFVRRGVESYTFGAIRDFKAAAKACAEFQANCIIGLPSQILQLARTAPHLQPDSAFITADYIADSLVQSIADIWHCEVLSHYGVSECGLGVGVECPAYAGYHMRYNDLLFEIIDPLTGEILPPGQYGEVVFSTLNREAMPLIRYRMGDIACLLDNKCECGGVLPRLSRIKGRLTNQINCGGSSISINQLDEIIFAIPEVLDYQPKLTNGILQLYVKTPTENLAKIQKIAENSLPEFNIQVLPGGGFYTRGTIKRTIITED